VDNGKQQRIQAASAARLMLVDPCGARPQVRPRGLPLPISAISFFCEYISAISISPISLPLSLSSNDAEVAHVRSLASATMPATASTRSLVVTSLTDLSSPSTPPELGWAWISRVALRHRCWELSLALLLDLNNATKVSLSPPPLFWWLGLRRSVFLLFYLLLQCPWNCKLDPSKEFNFH
jgi:hypothetical protein